MSKKFIKKNIFMLVFMSIAFIAVVVLLVMVYFEHKSMREYDAKKVELLKKIHKIFKQQYTPVKVNVLHIEGDAKEFDLESRKVEQKFGHPYEFALRRFAEVVAVPLKEFRAKFGEFWDSQKGKTLRDLLFRRYKKQFSGDFPNHRATWDAAMNAFMQEAQKVTLEEIDASNVDGIFLAAMGKGRRLSDSPQRCQTFMKRMRYNMIEYFGKKKIDCADTNFSFDDSREPPVGDIEAIANAWEIVSDLAKRVADAKVDPKKDMLQLVEFSKRGLSGEKDGDYTSYRFSFTVNADIATIRRIFDKLYEAYTENRVYAVRDIRITRMADKVSDILVESERFKDEIDYDSRKTQGNELPDSNNKNGVPKKSVKEQEKKKALTPKSPGYARTIIGGNNICRAEFEVDYIICDNMPND